MNYIRDSVYLESIDNTVMCFITENPLTLDSIQESIKNQDLRRQWLKMGEEDAVRFLELIETTQ